MISYLAFCQPYQVTWSKAPYYTCSRCGSFSSDSLLLHARSSFIGKKREMYEHPVFCLASQVMDLTIREYPAHLEPLHHFRHPSFFTFIVFLFSSTFKNRYSLIPRPAPSSCLACGLLAFFFEFVTCFLGWVIQTLSVALIRPSRPAESVGHVFSLFSAYSFCLWLECIFTSLLCKSPLYVYRCVPGLQYWPGTEWTNIIAIFSTPGTKQGFWCSFSNVDFCFCL